MIGQFTALCGGVIVFCSIAVYLNQINKEISILFVLAAGIFILFFTISYMSSVLEFVTRLISFTAISGEEIKILLKVLGLGYIVSLASDICNDSGQSALANKIETAGRLAILLVSLPLFEKVLKIIMTF